MTPTSCPSHTAERSFQFFAAEPADTDRLGACLAEVLVPGDTVALSGPLGAGKSQLARAVIRTKSRTPDLAVPSPSYTLVNVYEVVGTEIWHADLYRLSEAEDLWELGLEEAAETAILLVEWPERWPELPKRRIHVSISPGLSDGRTIRLQLHGLGWSKATAALEAFK